MQTDDAAHQRSQGQAPALSYEREAFCNAICSLDTTLFYKKNKNKEKKKHGLANHSHSLGDHMSTEPTCAVQKPQPHIFTHPTPTYVNHERQGLKAKRQRTEAGGLEKASSPPRALLQGQGCRRGRGRKGLPQEGGTLLSAA